MKSQKSKIRKAAKSKIRRKDFLKKKNIKNNNIARPSKAERITKWKAEKKDGIMTYIEAGKKTIMQYFAKGRLRAGDGVLPQSRKFKAPKTKKK